MHKSIATVCLSGRLAEKLKACASAGFDGVEIFENDLIVSPEHPSVIAQRVGDLGMTIDLYQPFRDFEAVPPEQLEKNLKRATAKFRVMNQLGCDLILACSNASPGAIPDDGLAAEQMYALADLAQDFGIRVAYEALAWGTFVSDFEHAMRVVELADHPSLGTCLDSFHILSRGGNPTAIERFDPQKIFFCQVSDAAALSMDVISWSRHHRVFPGQGSWDLVPFMASVGRSGYDGAVSLEVFNDVFRQAAPNRVAADGMRSLIWLEDQTAKQLTPRTTDNPTVGEPRQMTLDVLPAVQQPHGIDFVEVRPEAGRRAELETILKQLGFQPAEHRRTKDLRLWSQGHARLVVSGPSPEDRLPAITSIGFNVTDVDAALARALALGATISPRPTGAARNGLSALAAPNGTEVFHCVDPNGGKPAWVDEFIHGDAVPGDSDVSGISTIDHINLSQPWQLFDETVLFYRSVVGLIPQPSSEIAAPSGLVRSQVISSADGSTRLALNVAPLSIHGLEKTPADDYPEHVAFTAYDLIGFAKTVRDRGLDLLSIPQNYYDDLQARLDIDPRLLDQLHELGLLYDRDQFGSFIHFYTRTVGSVFFEIAQRIDGYDGYGAPNAPVRLAAQYS